MPNIVLAKPKQKHWIGYIKGRIKKNKNFLGFISGPTGSGKSWSSLSIGEQLDEDFSLERVVFSGLELMNLINSDKLKRGSVIVFEEVGVELSNKNWASITNKMINYLIQTFRHRGFILIMNSPFMDFLDSATRKLFHAEIRTLSINFKKKTTKLKPQLIQYNSRLQKFYYKRLKVIMPQGVMPVDVWNVEQPSKALVEAYETKKRTYTDKLNKKIYDELLAVENKGKEKSKLTDIQQDTLDLLKQGLNVEQIAAIRERHSEAIRASMKLIKNKGYAIKPVYASKVGKKILRYDVIEPAGTQILNNSPNKKTK